MRRSAGRIAAPTSGAVAGVDTAADLALDLHGVLLRERSAWRHMRPRPALIFDSIVMAIAVVENSTTAAVGVTGADLALDLHRRLLVRVDSMRRKRRVKRCAG